MKKLITYKLKNKLRGRKIEKKKKLIAVKDIMLFTVSDAMLRIGQYYNEEVNYVQAKK